jgi:pyruvate dehydrogenase E1 component alpha subunit
VRASAEEVEYAKRPDVDPLTRLETRLRGEGLLDDALAAEIARRTDDQLTAALLFARSSPKPPVDDGIDEVYSMPL